MSPQQAAHVTGVLDAVLAAARGLLRCELVAVNVLTPEEVVTARTLGQLPGLSPGVRARRVDTLCHLLLAGTRPGARALPRDPALAGAAAVEDLALRTYVGVPVQDADGRVVGTLCGFDRRDLDVDDRQLQVLEGLAEVLVPYAAVLDQVDASVVRAEGRWLVQGVDPEGSGTALAALLGGVDVPPARERDWLVANVTALEDATRTRVALEQVVGRVAERLGVPPLDAFHRLQAAARHDGGVVDTEGLVRAEPEVRSA